MTTEIGTTIEEEVVVEVWIGMIVIDPVEEIEIIAIEAEVAATVLIMIEVVAEIDMMIMKGGIGADQPKVPLLGDEDPVPAEAFHLVGVLHPAGALRLEVHLVLGVRVLIDAASMGALLALVVLRLQIAFHHVELSKVHAPCGVTLRIADGEHSQLSCANLKVRVLVHQ